MLNLKQYRDTAQGLSDLLNYACLPEDGIILGKDGSLMASWMYLGDDVDSATEDDLAVMSARINAVLSKLGNGMMLQTDAFRVTVDNYPMPENSFPDPITQAIDDERRRLFQSYGVQYHTVQIMTLTYLPPLEVESKFYTFLVDSPKGKKEKNVAAKHLQHFEQVLGTVERDLSPVVKMSRLRGYSKMGSYDRKVLYDQILEYVNFAVTGDSHPIRLPPCPMYLDSILGWRDFWGGLRPKIGKKHIATITIDGFPATGEPAILRYLAGLGCEYRWNTRFIFLDRHQSLKELKSYQKKWKQKIRGFRDQIMQKFDGQINEDAKEMAAEVDQAIKAAESGEVTFGYYTSVVVLMNENEEQLEEECNEVEKFIRNSGFSCRREDQNAIDAWLGSLPSHSQQNVRRPVIHTINLSDLLPMTSIWSGERFNPSHLFPDNSPPLFQAFTGGNTAFRGNVHVSDLGHFIVIGPPGAGKSTLGAFLDAQFLRYPGAKVFAFDKKYSMYALVMGAGGQHFDISNESGGSVHFCPLANIAESNAELMWAEKWIKSLCEYQGLKIQSPHTNAIHNAMMLLTKAESKTLTDFVATLQDQEIRDALKHYTLEGAMGSLLDAQDDTLSLSNFQVFEIDKLMELGDMNALPVLEYIFHRIERLLEMEAKPGIDGSVIYPPTIITIDEAWMAFEHPVFRKRLKKWLKELRKQNAVLGLLTQSISDAANSDILDVIADTCQTKFFLANPSAADPSSIEMYRKLGLNDKQIRIIAGLMPKRDYYVVQPLGKRVIQLALGKIALRWVGVSSTEQVQRLKKLINDEPDNWRKLWVSA